MSRFATFVFGFFCIFDLLALLPFAIPGISELHIAQLDQINQALGGAPIDAFAPVHIMLGGMLGVLGVGWSIWRWMRRDLQLVCFEGVLRLGFAAWFLGTGLSYAIPVVIVFGVVDCIAALLHFAAARNVFSTSQI